MLNLPFVSKDLLQRQESFSALFTLASGAEIKTMQQQRPQFTNVQVSLHSRDTIEVISSNQEKRQLSLYEKNSLSDVAPAFWYRTRELHDPITHGFPYKSEYVPFQFLFTVRRDWKTMYLQYLLMIHRSSNTRHLWFFVKKIQEDVHCFPNDTFIQFDRFKLQQEFKLNQVCDWGRGICLLPKERVKLLSFFDQNLPSTLMENIGSVHVFNAGGVEALIEEAIKLALHINEETKEPNLYVIPVNAANFCQVLLVTFVVHAYRALFYFGEGKTTEFLSEEAQIEAINHIQDSIWNLLHLYVNVCKVPKLIKAISYMFLNVFISEETQVFLQKHVSKFVSQLMSLSSFRLERQFYANFETLLV